MWRKLFVSLMFILGVYGVTASPFQLTDKYVEEFKAGIDSLQQLAREHKFKVEDFNPDLYNETAAAKAAVEYDFIIIGAGAAGSVVASRLSETPEWKVLLLEAGAAETPYTQIPKFANLLQNTPYNWAYTTTTQKNWCLGMVDNKCAIAGGKALGGSTAINGMLFTRGNSRDYDRWADLGNDGWCYDDVLPYFKKLEDADLEHFDHKYHNHGGPFHIEHPQYATPLRTGALEAAHEVDLDVVDYNGKEQLGLGVLQINTKHGKRQSSAQAYLEPARHRPNLEIKPLSHVLKILISPHTKTAYGVQFLHDGQLHEAKAAKEVILSAGAINTPQILMLSGVGPRSDLEHHNISCIEDLPVGRNFKDHISFFGLDFVITKETKDDATHADDIVEYLKNGKGPLTTPGVEVMGYVHTEASKDDPKLPDIEHYFVNRYASKDLSLNPYRFKPEIAESLWGPIDGKKVVNIAVMLAHPVSTGTVKLHDTDPLHRPLVDPNQLSDPDDRDLDTLLAGIKSALKLAHTKSMEELGIKINDNPVAGCETLKWGSDEYWKCAIKHLSISLRHVTGTARMGPDTDKEAVVDNKLKVKGVQKLRVADASVIPVTITGHTMAPALMIGEKASDLIKAAWK